MKELGCHLASSSADLDIRFITAFKRSSADRKESLFDQDLIFAMLPEHQRPTEAMLPARN